MLKVLELFSGTGCQVQALKNIGIECVSTQCEIDKYAINAYNQLHGETPNLGDITKVNPDNLQQGQWDLITYSFPCQSVSIAGKQAGLTKGSGTASSLLWECEKIIRKVKPKYLLMENVSNLLSDKFKHSFIAWLKILEEMGYCNYYDILNSKHFNIPQNRERVFCVSILGKHVPYVFPQKQPLKLKLKDMLEDKPAEKYYIRKEISNKFSFTINQEQKNTEILQIGNLYSSPSRDNPQRGRIYSTEGIAPACNTCQGGGLQAHIIEPINTETDGTAKTIKAQYAKTSSANFTRNGTFGATGVKEESIHTLDNHFRIRKLTPRECWRLMGWKDEQFDKIKGISNAQLYKMAGNGIVINVLEAIFTNMFLRKPTKQEDKFVVEKPVVQMELF